MSNPRPLDTPLDTVTLNDGVSAKLQSMSDYEVACYLANDNDFSIQTIAAVLRWIAGKKHNIGYEEMQNLTDEQWEHILYDYNSTNDYNEKCMEYVMYTKQLLMQ